MTRPSTTRILRLMCAAALCACGVLALPTGAAAKAERVVHYEFEQVWPAAIRFLRVDMGFAIVERDAEAGYVLFDVSEENKQFRGALEVVRFRDEQGRAALRLVLRIEDRPSYMEIATLKKLERKLRDELGAPREPPVPPPADNKPKARDET